MQKLIKRNYNAVVKRGLITHDTTEQDFMDKLIEEVTELKFEVDRQNHEKKMDELGDCLTVIFNWCEHFGIDHEILLIKTARKNENRAINNNL